MSKQGDKSNILSLDFLKEQHQEEFKMAEAWVDFRGEMLSFKYYERLPVSKQNEYIQEFLEFSYNTVNDEAYGDLGRSTSLYAMILLIEKFTDLEVPQDDKEKLAYAYYLTDFGLTEKIIDILPEEEAIGLLERGTEVVHKQTEKMKNLLEQYQNETGDIEEMSSLRLVEKDLGEEDNGE